MQRNISEKELKSILGAELDTSEIIESRTNEAYERIRNIKSRPVRENKFVLRKIVIGISGIAAAFLLMVTFCVMNPALAKEIPILGGLFSRLSDVFSFGRIPEEDTTVLFRRDEVVATEGSGTGDTRYQKTSNGMTITLTEEYASNQAVFIGVCVESEQEVPPLAVFQDGSQILYAQTVETYSFRPDSLTADRVMEGKWEDAHTFIGVMRIDYSEIDRDDSKYMAALQEAREKGEELPLTDANMWQYLEQYEVPDSFTMGLEITNVIGSLAEPSRPEGMKGGGELAAMTDEEIQAYMNTLPAEYNQFPNKYNEWWQEGNWSFELQIAQKDSASRIIEVNETNASGIGIKSIELSSVEMTLNVTGDADTIAVALDADGNKIDSGSTNAYELAIEGHDISKVYIYICDWDEYMDELKGYGVPGNHPGRSFQEVLEERALFKTVVDTGET